MVIQVGVGLLAGTAIVVSVRANVWTLDVELVLVEEASEPFSEFFLREQAFLDSRLNSDDGTDKPRREEKTDCVVSARNQRRLIERVLLERENDRTVEIEEHSAHDTSNVLAADPRREAVSGPAAS